MSSCKENVLVMQKNGKIQQVTKIAKAFNIANVLNIISALKDRLQKANLCYAHFSIIKVNK